MLRESPAMDRTSPGVNLSLFPGLLGNCVYSPVLKFTRVIPPAWHANQNVPAGCSQIAMISFDSPANGVEGELRTRPNRSFLRSALLSPPQQLPTQRSYDASIRMS